jgi:hypothetical protein
MARSARCLSLVMVSVILLMLVLPDAALAWKPYTHNFTGDRVWDDVVDDGAVMINNRSYPVPAQIRAAFTEENRPFYNAGIVGPDGFPDIAFGQAIIHPVKTGKWLSRIYVSAWQAQTDPSYSDQEKSQILAFMYGYLTHAAGDMWAHTLINDLSGKVFPAVGDVLTNVDDAEVAIRHIILEGYIGDATEDYDGNPERDAAPGGDISDDSTPGVPFAAPNRFVFETFINPQRSSPLCDGEDDDYDNIVDDGCPGAPVANGTSENSRGPLIDFFLNLRAQLVEVVSSHPMPVQAALDKFKGLKKDLDDVKGDCNFSSPEDIIHDLIACPAALAKLGFNVAIKSAEAFAAFVTEALKAAVKVVFDAYLKAWIDDIDDGLAHWNELGLASTKAFFDPQARRDTQNDECDTLGSESDAARINCEDGIGIVDTLLHEGNPFIDHHLLSMLGAPDFVGELRETLRDLADLLDEILAPLNIALNPIRNVLNEIKEFAKDLNQALYQACFPYRY